MRKNIFKNMEWTVLICAIVLTAIGLFALYSASFSANLDEFQKQITWLIISAIIMIIVMNIDYSIFVKISPVLYRHLNNIVNSSSIHQKDKWCNCVVLFWKCIITTK